MVLLKKFVLLLLLLTACTKINNLEGDEVTFLIKKGDHYSNNRWVRTGDLVIAKVYVDSSWIYYDLEPCWNKLAGLSHGIDPHNNSARIVWMCKDSVISIGGYFYRDGERNYEKLTEVQVGEWYYIRVWFSDKTYYITFGDDYNSYEMKVSGYKDTNEHYMLYPYFGGNPKAPHDMYFKFKFL